MKTKLTLSALMACLIVGNVALVEAADLVIAENNQSSQENVNISGAYDIGIYRNESGESNYNGENIIIDTTQGAGWGNGNVGVNATYTNKDSERAIINLGETGKTNLISINVVDNYKGASPNIAVGLWASGKVDNVNIQGGQINVSGNSLNITGYSESGGVYGIYAQNSTTTSNNKLAEININTDKTYINVSTGQDAMGEGNAIVAMSQGIIKINSNLEAYGDNAIIARGDAVVKINEDGQHTTKLNGDINFNYNGPTSGTKVDADVTVNLTGADSYWNGNSTVTWDYVADKKPDDTMLKVNDFKLTVADGAQWNPNKIDRTDDTYVDDEKNHVTGGAYLALNNLTLNDGIVNLEKMGDQALIVENVTGNGGIVNVASSDNKLEFKSNTIEALTVAATESYAEELVQNDMAESLQSLANQVADTPAGEKPKSAATDVYLSATSVTGITTAELDENGKVILDTVNERVNTSNNAISNMASIAYMAWRAENNDMNKRLGELRDSKGEHGIWARMVRGESEYESIKNQYNTYQLGYDEKLSTNPNWTVGAALSYTEGESGFNGGSGENKHTGFAVYGSYLNDDGSFIDLIAKYARLDHEFDVLGGAGSGDYETNGYSVSAEYGKRFKQSNGMWIEPQVELTYGKIGSANYKTSEGVSVRQDGMDSLVGRVGFALGKDFEQGNAYVRASYLYDFEGETDVSFTKGNVTRGFEQDLGGGWFEVGVGTNINLSDATHVYLDVEKTYGGDVATPWQWNVGVRYSF